MKNLRNILTTFAVAGLLSTGLSKDKNILSGFEKLPDIKKYGLDWKEEVSNLVNDISEDASVRFGLLANQYSKSEFPKLIAYTGVHDEDADPQRKGLALDFKKKVSDKIFKSPKLQRVLFNSVVSTYEKSFKKMDEGSQWFYMNTFEDALKYVNNFNEEEARETQHSFFEKGEYVKSFINRRILSGQMTPEQVKGWTNEITDSLYSWNGTKRQKEFDIYSDNPKVDTIIQDGGVIIKKGSEYDYHPEVKDISSEELDLFSENKNHPNYVYGSSDKGILLVQNEFVPEDQDVHKRQTDSIDVICRSLNDMMFVKISGKVKNPGPYKTFFEIENIDGYSNLVKTDSEGTFDINYSVPFDEAKNLKFMMRPVKSYKISIDKNGNAIATEAMYEKVNLDFEN